MTNNIDLSKYFRKTIHYGFFISLLFSLIAGLFLYGFIVNKGFNFADELAALLYSFTYIIYCLTNKKIGKEFIYFFIIILFYFFYGLCYGQNINKAVITDFFIILKPFIVFYASYYITFQFTHKEKRIIKFLIIVCSLLAFTIGIRGQTTIEIYFQHVAQFASCMTAFSLLYLYFSKGDKKDILIAFIILSIGLLSSRSKFYGFYVCYIVLFFSQIKLNTKKLLNAKTIFILIITIGIILLVVKEKMYSYIILGGIEANDDSMFARPALYVGMINILEKYPLLGCGMGSYASFGSALYYSPIYERFGLSNIYGLQPNYPDFITDTFFPCFAQYGIIGIYIFYIFWKKRIQEAKKYFTQKSNTFFYYKICILILCFFIIESLADSTFTQNRGMFIMGILGIILKDGRINYYQNLKSN